MVRWRRGARNADLGGGRYGDLTRHLARRGVRNVVYDPGWQDEDTAQDALRRMQGSDTVTVSNVLNVIPSRRDRRGLMALAARVLRPGGVAYVTTYVVDRGHLGHTVVKVGRDGRRQYQLNRPLEFYVPDVEAHFLDVRVVRHPNGRVIEACLSGSHRTLLLAGLHVVTGRTPPLPGIAAPLRPSKAGVDRGRPDVAPTAPIAPWRSA
jgi:hypothetical protein